MDKKLVYAAYGSADNQWALPIKCKVPNKLYSTEVKYYKNVVFEQPILDADGISGGDFFSNLLQKRLCQRCFDIIEKNGTLIFDKPSTRTFITTKPDLTGEKLIHTEICVVSDTHLGNIHQQLHLLNQIYQEAYNRGIKIVLHCGDLVDGNYPNRPEQPRQQFLHGFDEQAGYVVDMYPKVEGITTKYILGSHDETHYKNGQATVSNWVSRCRDDMDYLGQDSAAITINGVKIFMDHPGGGSAQALSYKPQKRIEILESDFKPKILLIGHYHKSYSFVYRNVRGICVGSCCDTTQFQQKKILSISKQEKIYIFSISKLKRRYENRIDKNRYTFAYM